MKVFAHRGASRAAPENSLDAFRLAARQGAAGVELDVHLSRDGRIIVCHDPDTGRTTGLHRIIADTDAKELGDLPQLADVMACLPRDLELLVEIKCGPWIVPALVQERLPEDRISFLSFDSPVLSAVKKALPGNRCLLNIDPPQRFEKYDWTELEVLCALHAIDGVSLGWHKSVTEELVNPLRASGRCVAVWTVDDPAEAKQAREAGVDILMTNEPGRIISELSADET